MVCGIWHGNKDDKTALGTAKSRTLMKQSIGLGFAYQMDIAISIIHESEVDGYVAAQTKVLRAQIIIVCIIAKT